MSHDSSTDIHHTLDIPAGQEFTGLAIYGAESGGCQITHLAVATRPAMCSVSLDLSQVAGASQNVIAGATETKSFTATPWECGTTAIEYQVTEAPTSTTPNLISLSTSSPLTIVFSQSINPADAKQFTVTLKARLAGSADWFTPAGTATATYTYIDLCASTILTPPTLSTMTTSVLKQSSPGGGPFQET